MSELQPKCERCGGLALVHITNEIGQEGPARHLCLECATEQDAAEPVRDRRLSRAAMLVVLGAHFLGFSVFADQIGFGRNPEFGWKQDVVLVLGLVLVLVGALIRVSTVFVIGVIMTVLAVLADWLRLGGESGFGPKQMAGTAAGFLLILGGFRWARGRGRRRGRAGEVERGQNDDGTGRWRDREKERWRDE